ncbi:hypothetical protein DL89DRAFT_268721 [Linderina pennispora]|uniref:Myb/SANT-like DNA-binding domain-containing protein n=1 Tax=Linderina pennispora TaxID=61395 RepID=A0A1Y1W3R9_9FUNG|nr:uncharacterized protein DL89DRAFT_268721 [Linderina pennispora]ORX68193.1 hypothetical protein DL89DRAFT_268721 [Linderina pennispora]
MDADMSEPKVEQQQEQEQQQQQSVVEEVPVGEVAAEEVAVEEHQQPLEEQPLEDQHWRSTSSHWKSSLSKSTSSWTTIHQQQDAEQHQYEQQYDASYDQQYEAAEDAPQEAYDETQAQPEYEQDQAYDDQVVVDAAAVATAAAAAAAQAEEQQYAPDDQQQQYAQDDQQQYDQQHEQQYEQQYETHEQMDDQTLAAHPARELQAAESQPISAEVSQAMDRYDDAPWPQPRPVATPHTTTHVYHQKPLTPKFNRARNWTRDETKILLNELERIVAENPEDRREVMLRAHPTFEQTANVLREHGFVRDGQGCMIRWRNLLRDPSVLQGYPYANEIESIYRFPPENISSYHMHGESGSPGPDGSQTGHARTWTQANGSAYETPARKRQREMHQLADQIERMEQKLDQATEVISQQSEIIRSLEERVVRAEEALKQSETTLETINTTIGEKDAKRDELEKQLMVTVQALSQVIATKKAEQQ